MGLANFSKILIKHQPEIMIIGGTVGMIAGGVMGVKATLKINDAIAESKDNLENVKLVKAANDDSPEYNKDLTFAYLRLVGDLAKLYGPAALVTGISAYSVIKGNNIFRKRNLALCASAYALQRKLLNCEGHLVETLGEEAAYKIRNGIESRIIEETNTDENGKEKKVKKEVEVYTEDPTYSVAAKFFCESSKYWEDDPEENLNFLRSVEHRMNEKFSKQGYLFLNDVYRALDIPETEIGSAMGWVKGYGDSFVDFGIYNCYREGNHRFVNGLEPVVLLDFNHQGYILNLL